VGCAPRAVSCFPFNLRSLRRTYPSLNHFYVALCTLENARDFIQVEEFNNFINTTIGARFLSEMFKKAPFFYNNYLHTSSFAAFVNAVLIYMEGVEEVRISGLLARGGRRSRPGRNCRVQVEGSFFRRGHPQFTVVLELGT
jgi:hypothetical protein